MTEAGLKRRIAAEFERYRSGRVAHPDLDDAALFVELLLEWSPAEVDEAAALLLYLVQFPAARDAALLQWATDLATGDRLWQCAADGSLERDQLAKDLKVGLGPRPDPARLDRGISIAERLTSVASEQYAAAPRFMLTWLHWARVNWP